MSGDVFPAHYFQLFLRDPSEGSRSGTFAELSDSRTRPAERATLRFTVQGGEDKFRCVVGQPNRFLDLAFLTEEMCIVPVREGGVWIQSERGLKFSSAPTHSQSS